MPLYAVFCNALHNEKVEQRNVIFFIKKKDITKEALEAGLRDDQGRCAKVTWLNNFKPWEHIQRTSSRAEEKEL